MIRWVDPGGDLVVQAIVRDGQTELGSDAVTIPPTITTKTTIGPITLYSSAESHARCGRVRGRFEPGFGLPVILTANPNESFDLGSIQLFETRNYGKMGHHLKIPEHANMIFDIKEPKRIQARAWCTAWADEQFGWGGYFQVRATTTQTSITAPESNGLKGKYNQAPAP